MVINNNVMRQEIAEGSNKNISWVAEIANK